MRPNRPPASVLAEFARPRLGSSLWQLGNSATLFVATWLGIYFVQQRSYWLALALVPPASFFLVRLFIIQHDCGHGSFFANQKLANWVGRAIGVMTLTPYACWRRQHATHHSTSGNLDLRGIGDIKTLTVAEYRSRTPWQRFWYRVYRHPLLIFGIGASVQFVLRQRLPSQVPKDWRRERNSVWLTNLAIVAAIAALGWAVGYRTLAKIQLPITIFASSVGVWLFYVQHQYERTYWEPNRQWSYDDAALEGSSHLALPAWLQWATGNIGLHHIHHLSSRIPNYRLEKALAAHPELEASARLGLREAIGTMRLALWDEEQKRLISFRDEAAAARPSA